MKTHELFIAAFTGGISTFVTKEGKRVSMKMPLPRVEKGCGYVAQIDTTEGYCRMIPIVVPN